MGNTQAVQSCLAMAPGGGDASITGVLAREILDSRGNPTVEVSTVSSHSSMAQNHTHHLPNS